MVDRTEVRIRLPGGLVDAEFATGHHVRAHPGKAGGELGQVGQRGSCTRVLVVIQRQRAVVVEDRHQRTVEAALANRLGRAGLAVDGELIELLARKALDGGDEVGRDALRHHVVLVAKVIVVGREAVDVHRCRTRHRLDATSNHQILEAGQDARCREVDRLLARTTEAIERDTGRLCRPARVERRHPRDVHRVVAAAGAATHHDIVDRRGVESVATLQLVEHLGEDPLRMHVVQRAGVLALAPRRADGIDDVREFSHGCTVLTGPPALRGEAAPRTMREQWDLVPCKHLPKSTLLDPNVVTPVHHVESSLCIGTWRPVTPG